MKKENNILVLSSWSFAEPLVHSYLLPNLHIIRKHLPVGSMIYLQTSEKKNFALDKASRLQIRKELERAGIEWKPLPYKPFGLRAIFSNAWQILLLIFFILRKKIDILHPFAAAAGTTALFLRSLTGKKIVLDSWEPHAESMVETGVWRKKSLAFRMLWWSEKKQVQKASALIAASRGMIKYAEESYRITPHNVFFRPACVDLQLFDPARFDRRLLREKMNLQDKVVCACVSKLGGLYLRDEAFNLFKAGTEIFGKNFHVLLLSQNEHAEILQLCARAEFDPAQLTHMHCKYEDVPYYLSMCDFAFNPQQPVASKRYGTPVKDGEYWAMGLPVMLLPEISEDSAIITSGNAGVILPDLEYSSMVTAMKNMNAFLESDYSSRSHRIREIAKKYRSYEIAERTYRSIYGQHHDQ